MILFLFTLVLNRTVLIQFLTSSSKRRLIPRSVPHQDTSMGCLKIPSSQSRFLAIQSSGASLSTSCSTTQLPYSLHFRPMPLPPTFAVQSAFTMTTRYPTTWATFSTKAPVWRPSRSALRGARKICQSAKPSDGRTTETPPPSTASFSTTACTSSSRSAHKLHI
jgi:hypothetical protein